MKVSKKGLMVIVNWNTAETKDIEEARNFFIKLSKQGWMAAKFNGELKRVLEFKPEYEKLWFLPIIEGGEFLF